ncbi:nucleoside monophosphate kinase [bacterium]|nr:nucleoside monophosphate kinase [bacterium]
MTYKIILLGPQGSGKGTQAQMLAKRLGVPALAMGQLLRDEVAAKSEIGLRVDGILKSGNLVSDEVAAEVLQARLKRDDAANGYVLDGYPRNLKQYAMFTFDEPTHVLVLDVSREESLARLGGRLTCDRCGAVRSTSDGSMIGDACECGGAFMQRTDDTPEAIGRRLDIYENDTTPMLAKFEERGLLVHVDGMGGISDVEARILTTLGL